MLKRMIEVALPPLTHSVRLALDTSDFQAARRIPDAG